MSSVCSEKLVKVSSSILENKRVACTNICIHIGQNTLGYALGATAQSCKLGVVELKDSVSMEVCLLRLRKSNIPNQSLEIT